MRQVRLLILALVLLPTGANAQRRTTARGRVPVGRPAPPVPLPPQPAPIARSMTYYRLPISAESYTFVSRVGFSTQVPGAASSWTTFGTGVRLAYRLASFLSPTLDLTSSLFGGPSITQSVELGFRVRPADSERKVYPFADVRGGYMLSNDSYLFSSDPTVVSPTVVMRGSRFGGGPGAVAGGGAEAWLSRTVSMTAGAWAIRSRMTAYRASGLPASTDPTWWMTSYRFALGVKYNPVRTTRTTSALPADR